jgi:phage baseplate assembly protein W
MRPESLIAMNKTEGHAVCMDDMRNAYQIFVSIPKGNRPMKAMTIRQK